MEHGPQHAPQARTPDRIGRARGARRPYLRAAAALALFCGTLIAPAPLLAQQPAGEVTGALARTRLPVPVIDGPVEFAATRTAAWTERTADGRDITRLVLKGDIRVRLGIYRFGARQAAAWIAPLPPGDPDAGPLVFQVFIYFDGVGTADEDAAVALTADQLSVQGIFRVPEAVVLKTDVRTEGPGRPDALVREAERKLAAYLERVAEGEQPAIDMADVGREIMVEPEQPVAPTVPTEDPVARRIAEASARLAAVPRDEPIFARDGLFTVAAGDVVISKGTDERVVTITGDERHPITVIYWDAQRDQTLQLTAERAVIFLDPGEAPAEAQFPAREVRGIYLEGDVYADNGQYRLRSPKVFYSVRDDRAVLIDAVFWTYDEQRGLPLYVRARTIEQLSEQRFRATKARLTNTAFHDPGLALGASSVTISPPRREGAGPQLDVRNLSVRLAGLPILWFPRYRGDPSSIPIREVGIDASSGHGIGIKTGWNGASLLGIDLPPGQTLDFLADYYFERGPALGADWEWSGDRARGAAVVYSLPYDAGSDLTSTGRKVDRSGDLRMIALGEHRTQLNEKWELWAQGFWISDATFVDAWFDTLARNRREFENSVYLKRNGVRSSLTAEVKSNFVDFISNEYLLQSQGYTVERAPEATYTRLADDVLAGLAPGLLTYTSDYRVGRVAFEFDEEEADDRGFQTLAQSGALFGILPSQSPADALRAQGLNSESVTRFDTRHELSAQLRAGPLNVTPFATGRFTGWDHTFTDFSPEADEKHRWWGSVGGEVSTEISRIDNGVHSRLLDLHRIRHIVTPRLALWSARTTIDREDLPVYDEGVESIEQGDAMRLALDQRWQTYRGGPGRSRAVDVFTLDLELVMSDKTGPARSPIGRWIGYRPEGSSLGDFATAATTWQVSEVVALAGHTVFDLDSHQQDRTSIGGMIQHTPDFATFGDLRYINSQDQTFADVGLQYVLTPKYAMSGYASYDTDRGRFQVIGGEIRRAFPNVWLGVSASYNDINENLSLGIVVQPRGLPGISGRASGQRFGAGFGGRSPLLGG